MMTNLSSGYHVFRKATVGGPVSKGKYNLPFTLRDDLGMVNHPCKE
jgi:hypothetical protein